MTIAGKIMVLLGSILLMAAVCAAAFLSQPAILFIPVVAVAALLFSQYPQALYYTLLFSIPWSMEFNFSNSLGTDLPDEPLMLLMAFITLALVLSRKRNAESAVKLATLLLILCVGFAWAFIAVCASTNFLLSAKYFLAKSWYLAAFVGAPLALKGDEKLIRRSALVLFVSMFVVACIALMKHAAFNFTFIKINVALSPFFRNHVNYSALLVFMVPLQIAFFRTTKSGWLRILIFLSMIVVLAALALSYARGAWLALVVGSLAYWFIRKGWLLKAFIVTLIAVGGFAFWLQHNDNYLQFAPDHNTTIFHENFGEHLVATYRGKDVSTAERFYRWTAGARMGKEKWFAGFGPTTFYQEYKSYTIPLFRTWVSDNRDQSTVHNYFLLLLIEQGVPGLLFFLLLVGAMFWQAQKIYNQTSDPFWKITVAAIATILWMQCTVNFLSDLIETDKVGSVFYLCLAFLIIAGAKTKHMQKDAYNPTTAF